MLRGDLRRALALVRRRTHRGPAVHVRLMEKADCHLCAEAHRALRRIALERPLEIERVDIATLSSQERDRYVLRIPVLVAGVEELDAAGLEDAAIVRWLRTLSGAG
jgi:coenzyme F420-reducing hydrogenase delta subunit